MASENLFGWARPSPTSDIIILSWLLGESDSTSVSLEAVEAQVQAASGAITTAQALEAVEAQVQAASGAIATAQALEAVEAQVQAASGAIATAQALEALTQQSELANGELTVEQALIASIMQAQIITGILYSDFTETNLSAVMQQNQRVSGLIDVDIIEPIYIDCIMRQSQTSTIDILIKDIPLYVYSADILRDCATADILNCLAIARIESI
jgi:hypothetical protein